jgi:hypothetical protein
MAKAFKEYSGEAVAQLRCTTIWGSGGRSGLGSVSWKTLVGALWDSDTNAIMLDEEHYLGHCRVD